jgi:hypothetical protein
VKVKKRKKRRSLTPLSMKLLRDRGYIVERVEQRLPIPGMFVTRDFANFADLIAFRAGKEETHPGLRRAGILGIRGEILAVQVTDASHLAVRSKKVREEPMAREWLLAGGKIMLHGWNGSALTEREVMLP